MITGENIETETGIITETDHCNTTIIKNWITLKRTIIIANLGLKRTRKIRHRCEVFKFNTEHRLLLGFLCYLYFYHLTIILVKEQQADYYQNYDWDRINMPIKVDILENMLINYKYNEDKTKYLVDGFKQGFSIGYCRPQERNDTADNLPLNNLGTETDLWNKVMKEVKLNRYAGPYPFEDLPIKDSFIQFPIGLVPKASNQTRLIFHLSYDFKNGNTSVNANTPHEICHVRYRDLDHVIDTCIKLMNKQGHGTIFFSKTDIKSAFCLVPVLVLHRKWLVLMAEDPQTKEKAFFIDMCLPFGASISCAVFQACTQVSD